MSAIIIALAGPLAGNEYSLEDQLSIGRGTKNTLFVTDKTLSRHHCAILGGGPPFVLRDRGSKNGTFVNGRPVTEHSLADGDQIKAGCSVFLFLEGKPQTVLGFTGLDPEPETLQVGATVLLRQSDAICLEPEKLAEFLPNRDRALCDLKALLRIGAAIPSIRDLEPLQRELLEQIFRAIPAERGAILLTETGSDELASAFYRRRIPSPEPSLPVSRTVVRRVLEDNSAILSNDVLVGVKGAESESIVAARISSLLAVPMMTLGRTLGVLYLDATDPQTRFDEGHLRLLAGIAGMAAATLDNALHIQRLENDKRRLAAEINLEHNLIGESPAIQAVLQFLAKAAPSASNVLIHGESGTGKELIARALHANSPRAGGAFVAINCAALTETLLETELFGHEKGAFTGAIAQKRGQLEEAHDGTVFLDEVGELAPGLQAKLLRVLQEHEFRRVGGARTIKANFRLIAATNRDLEDAVRQGTFRQDLYYRLNVVAVTAPALREHKQDIPLLAQYFVQKCARNMARPAAGLSRQAMAALMSYDWPGNVRELENAIERAFVLGSTDTIFPEDLPETVIETYRPSGEPPTTFREAVVEAKKQIIWSALEQTGGNYVETGRLLGLHPSNLHRLIRNLNLSRPAILTFREEAQRPTLLS